MKKILLSILLLAAVSSIALPARAQMTGAHHTALPLPVAQGGTANTAAFPFLSALFSDVTPASPTRGDGVFAIGATPTWQHLAHSSATGGYFKWNGTDVVPSTGAASGTGACPSQVVTGVNADASPTCAAVTSAMVDSTVLAGVHYAPIPSSDTISAAGVFATTQSISNTGLKAGSMITTQIKGRYTTTSTSSPTMQFEVNAGGTTGICGEAISTAPATSITAGWWAATCLIQIQTTGNPGTALAWGTAAKAVANGTTFSNLPAFPNSGAQNYITTSPQTLSVQEMATLVSGQTFTLDALDIHVDY